MCLIPHFIAVFVRHKMFLVAQFKKRLFRIFFFGAKVFDVNIHQKSHCWVACVFQESTELRKADRTVGVNCNIFSNISLGTA